MSLNVGSLVAYLDLNDDNFDRKTKHANKQIDGLILHLETLKKIKPDLDVKVTAKTEELTALQARLVELKASAAEGADVRVDVAETMFKLAAVKAEIRALHDEAGKSLKMNTSDANQQLEALAKSLDNVGGKLRGLNVPGGMFANIAAFGPMLIPAGNAAIGVLGGIGAAAVEAAGGVGVLMMAFKGASNATTAYQAYQTAMLKATNSKQRTAATNTLNASAYGQASASTQAFARFDVNQLKPFGSSLASSAQAGVLPGLTMGLGSMIKDAPQINGAIKSIANAMGSLFAEAGRALDSPFWKQWLTFFGRDSAANLQTMGNTIGQVIEGLARMMERGSGSTHSLLGDLDAMATRFNHWTAGDGFTRWLASVQTDGHQAAVFLGQVWSVLKPLLEGAGQAGRAELTLLGGTFSLIAHLPTDWLVAAGHWLPLIFLAAKLGAPIMNGLGIGMQSVSRNLKTMAEDGATKMQVFKAGFLGTANVIAGTAGVGLILDSLMRTSSAFSGMETVAGGALAGFSAGGWWGAAIGAAAGGFLALIKGVDSTQQAFHASLPAIQDWVTAVEQVGKAGRDAQRQLILTTLQDPKNHDALGTLEKTFGLSESQVITGIQNGTLGGRVNMAAIQAGNAANAAIAADSKQESITQRPVDTTNAKNLLAYEQELWALNTVLQGINGQYLKGSSLAWQQTQATAAYATALDKLPKSVQTAINATNIKPTTESVITLAAKYHATPKSVQTYLEALGTDLSISKIDALIAQAERWQRMHPSTTVSADTRPAVASLNSLERKLVGLSGSLIPTVPGIPTPKKGKVGHNALGTPFWGGGLSWVGEQGPELIRLPRGSQVYTHARSEQMAADGRVHLSEQSVQRLAAVITKNTQTLVGATVDMSSVYYGG